MICFRCEKQLQEAFHLRQLAESSSKHFATIRSSNNSTSSPRILNSSTNQDLDAGKQWIEITNQNSETIDVTLKSEIVSDEETSRVIYTVDVNGADGNIKVIPREPRSRSQANTINNTKCVATEAIISSDIEYSDNDDDHDDDHSDAISFLLKNKHLMKKKNDTKSDRKYECTVCTKKFVGKSNLVDHLRYHANIRNYKCDYCDKSFVQSGSLKSHLRTHTGSRPFICNFCEKGFGQKSALTVHIRTHTQERKFVCDFDSCSKAFMTTGDLVKHKLIHDPIKKYSCDVCGMRSAQKVNVKKHKLRVHGIPDGDVYPVTGFP